MSGSPPSAPTGVPAPRAEDPAAAATADKRVLVIAVVVMLLLVSVGVVSGALFNRSACATIDPEPVTAGLAGGAGDVDRVLAASFPDTDQDTLGAMAGAFASLSERLGPVTGVAEVTGATGLGVTERGVAAIGPVTSSLDTRGSEVLARVDVGDGQVVGSGDTLWSVAAVNELTGQVDAVTPLDPELEAQTCVNTSLINSPLAFALDARDGELLLLRINEDGGEPELELRDPVQGRVWGPALDIGIGQPGLQAARLTGRLGPGTVVTGLRTAPGDGMPVMTAVERGTGEPVWHLGRGDLDALLDDELAQTATVWAVGENRAIVSLSVDPDPDEPADVPTTLPTRLLALDPGSGESIWDAALGADDAVRHVELDGDAAWITISDGDEVRFERFDADGDLTFGTGTAGDDGRTAVLDDGRVVTASADSLGLIEQDELFTVGSDLQAREVAAHGDAVTLLVDGPDGGTVAVTFGT
jgi:hypothetical protein